MKAKKKKSQKPTDIDAHFKYRCSSPSCNYDYWISLKQAQTPNFKIVCDCGEVFSPKSIVKIKILYKSKVKIPLDTLRDSVKILVDNGFSEQESKDIVSKGFAKCKEKNSISLVRYILQHLGELNVNN